MREIILWEEMERGRQYSEKRGREGDYTLGREGEKEAILWEEN